MRFLYVLSSRPSLSHTILIRLLVSPTPPPSDSFGAYPSGRRHGRRWNNANSSRELIEKKESPILPWFYPDEGNVKKPRARRLQY